MECQANEIAGSFLLWGTQLRTVIVMRRRNRKNGCRSEEPMISDPDSTPTPNVEPIFHLNSPWKWELKGILTRA